MLLVEKKSLWTQVMAMRNMQDVRHGAELLTIEGAGVSPKVGLFEAQRLIFGRLVGYGGRLWFQSRSAHWELYKKEEKREVVTPSVHLGVPASLSVTPATPHIGRTDAGMEQHYATNECR